jgi:hypothetical protein
MVDKDRLKAKFSKPCEYCTYAPEAGDKLNGLDRVDSKGKYSDNNTVACCSTCNYMNFVMFWMCCDDNLHANVTHLHMTHKSFHA